MIDNSNDEVNFPYRLLLTDRQVANLCKGFENNLSANIKLSKTKLSKIIQLGGFHDKVLGPLMKVGLLLIKNVLQPLAKSVLIPLQLRGRLLGLCLCALVTSLLGNMLTRKDFIWAGDGAKSLKGQGTIRAGQDF